MYISRERERERERDVGRKEGLIKRTHEKTCALEEAVCLKEAEAVGAAGRARDSGRQSSLEHTSCSMRTHIAA